MNTAATLNAESIGAAPLVERRAPVELQGPRFMSPRAIERTAAVLAPLALLALWELAVRTGALDVRFFPAPTQIIQTFYAMTFSAQWDQSLGYHTLVSLSRALIGFLFGAIPAVMLGTHLARRHPPPLSQAAMRQIVFVLLFLSGVSLGAPAVIRMLGF